MAAIDTLGGIGSSLARRFRRSGIRTTDALLRRAATRAGRDDLAARLDIAEQELLELVLRVDLMRIHGVGARYAELLNEAGVFTAEQLRTRDPETLWAMIVQINSRKRMVSRLPNAKEVRKWVAEAQTFRPFVER